MTCREPTKLECAEAEIEALREHIAELEKRRDVEYVTLDDRQLVYLTVDDLKRIKLEQQAKGVREALTKAKRMGGGFLHECLFEDYIHDLQTQAKVLKRKE
tara:strand:- start:149 stop:451 length:303 start_codon:yes stop_codon:yes gene_type:complete